MKRRFADLILFCIVTTLFMYGMYKVQEYEEEQEKICEDKGMILVRPYQDSPYCTEGTREDL